MSTPQRLGLLGGTFDPIHLGHVAAADAARRALGLDVVWLIPSHVPPHRNAPPVASAFHRFAMAALTADAYPGLQASDLELREAAPSYTTTTLQRLADAGHAPGQLFFITGVDAFAEIATWRGYPALLGQAHFVVVSRPGHDVAALGTRLPQLTDRLWAIDTEAPSDDRPPDATLRIFTMRADTPNVASSTVRDRVRDSGTIDDLLPDPVARYIRAHHLYAPAPPGNPLA